MANELKAKLVIESEAQGSEEIIKLRGEVDKLGDSAELAGPEFEALAQEVARLGQQQAAISQFDRLKQSVGELAKRTQELQGATREAALALKEKQAALAAATRAEQTANEQLGQASAQHQALSATIKALGVELGAMAKAAKATGDSSAAMAERLADGKAQLQVLRAEAATSAQNIKLLAAAQKESAAAMQNAGREVGAAQKQFEALRQSTKQNQTSLDAQNVSLQRARDELGKLGISSSALAKSQSDMNQGLQRSRGALERLAQQAQQTAAVMADRDLLGVRAHADIQKEIDETRAAYERLKASGKLTQTELAQAALKSEERIRDLKHQTNGWLESIGKAKVAMGGMAAGVAGLSAVIGKAVEFESAMADVGKVVDGTDRQMAALTSRIKQMTATIPMAASELAQIAAAGGQLGVPIEKLDQFIELAAQMATAFNMSAEQAGQAVAKLSNIFSLPMEQVRALGDAINVLGNTTAAKEADIVDVLTRIGGSARQFGLTAEQAAALGTAMLSLGVTAEVAGTGINAILSKLQTASIQSKDFQEALAEVGVSAKQLGEDIRANPQKALEQFLQTLSQLDGAKQAEVLSRLFGTEYQDDVARLLAGLDGYQRALQSVGNSAATAGAMHKEFQTRVATSEAQIKLLKNGVETLATNLGTVFLPMLKVVVGGLADVSHAVAFLAERFPILAGAATALTALAVGASGAKMAYLALSVAASKAGVSLSGAAVAAGTTAAANTALAKSADVASAANDKLGKSADTAKSKLTLLGAAARGGLALAAADGVISVVKLGQAIADLIRVREHLAQAQAQGAKLDKEMAQRLQDISQSTGVVVTSYEELMAAQERGLLKQDEATGKWLSAAQAQEQLAPKLERTAEALAKQQAELARTDASVLVAEFEKASAGAEKAEGAIKKLADSLKFGDVTGASAFAMALDELAAKGKLTAEQVGEAWKQALAKLSVGEIGALRANLEDAGRQGVLTAQQVAQANDQILSASFAKLGVNAAQAMGKISEGAKEAIEGIGLVAEAAKSAGASTEQAARAIEMAFVAAVPKADSLEAIKAMEERLVAMGKAGQISAEGMERVKAALDKQKAAIEGQIPGIQSVQEALRQLGVKPQAELDALAKSAKAAFDVIKASGTATPREVSEAWKAMAEASIAANNGAADAVLEAQASQHGFVIETDKAGKAIVKSMQEAAEATKGVGDAAKAAGEAAAEGAAAAGEATDRFARDASGQILKLEGTWLDAEAAASNYSAQVAEMVYSLNKPLELMRQEHLAMVRSLEALDAAQQRLQSNGASSVDDLRLRLLELNGTEEQIAEARQRREIAEVERNKRLMEIQLKRARMLGNEEDVAAAEFELQMLNEQLKLLEQIHKEEDKQRDAKAREAKRQQEEREREERERASRDASGGSSGSSSTSAVDNSRGPVTFSPTFNAYGVTDPVVLARQMAPVFEKMARLTR